MYVGISGECSTIGGTGFKLHPYTRVKKKKVKEKKEAQIKRKIF